MALSPLWADDSQVFLWANNLLVPKTIQINSVDIDVSNPANVMTFRNDVMALQLNIPYVRESQYMHNWSSYSAYPQNPSITDPGTPDGDMSSFTPGSTTNGRLLRFWSGTRAQFSAEFGGVAPPDDVRWEITDDVTELQGNAIDSVSLINTYLTPFRQEVMRGTSTPFSPLPNTDPNYAVDGGTYLYSPTGGLIRWLPFVPANYIPANLTATVNINTNTFDLNCMLRPFGTLDASDTVDAISGMSMSNIQRTNYAGLNTNIRLGFGTSPYMTYADMTSGTPANLRVWLDTSGVYSVNSRTQNTNASTLTSLITTANVRQGINNNLTLIEKIWNDIYSIVNIPAQPGAQNNDPLFFTRRSIFSELTAIRTQLNRYPSFGTSVISEPTASLLALNTDFVMRSAADGGSVTMKTLAQALIDANAFTIPANAMSFLNNAGQTIWWNYNAAGTSGNGTSGSPLSINTALQRAAEMKYFTDNAGAVAANQLKVVITSNVVNPGDRAADTLYFAGGTVAFGSQSFGVMTASDIATQLAGNTSAMTTLAGAFSATNSATILNNVSQVDFNTKVQTLTSANIQTLLAKLTATV
jgi:hypothetical protein